MTQGVFLPPNGPDELARIDSQRIDVIEGSSIRHDYRGRFGRTVDRLSELGPTVVEVEPNIRQRALYMGARVLRGAGFAFGVTHAALAVNAYDDLQSLDEDIVAAIEASGYSEFDAELENTDNLLEFIDFIGEPEQQETLAEIQRELSRDFQLIEESARENGEDIQQNLLSAMAFAALAAGAWSYIAFRNHKAKKDSFILWPHNTEHVDNGFISASQQLNQPAPRRHVTRAGDDDTSRVMRLTVGDPHSNLDFMERGALWYGSTYGKLLLGGLIVLNPLSAKLADTVDDQLDIGLPVAVQDTTSSIDQRILESEQARIEDAVASELKEKLPNTTRLLGNDLDDITKLLSSETDLEVSGDPSDAVNTQLSDYRPLGTRVDLAAAFSDAYIPNPYEGDNRSMQRFFWLMLATTGILAALTRSLNKRPIFARDDGILLMSELALERAICEEKDDREATKPTSLFKRLAEDRRRNREVKVVLRQLMEEARQQSLDRDETMTDVTN